MFLEKELKKLETKKNSLEKKDIDLIISDLDDTLFSTHEIIKKDYRKWRRWWEWNIFLKENPHIIKEIIKNEYKNKDFPQTIVSKLRINHDLILTKWIEEYQIPKFKATWLDKFNYIITEHFDEKITETIKYVINTLWFIPSKIIVYEDRPDIFIENKKIIEDFLWTKLEIIYVEMDWNKGYKKLEKITWL